MQTIKFGEFTHIFIILPHLAFSLNAFHISLRATNPADEFGE